MEQKKSIFNSDTVLGLCGIALGAWWLIMAMGLPGTTAKDGTPGPSVFPVGISALLILLSVLLVVSGVRNKVTYFKFSEITTENRLALLLSAGLFVVFMLLWLFVHYLVASLVLSAGLCLIYGVKPVKAAIFSVIFASGTYFFFSKVLMVMLDL